jgi:large subunit ribosomal protein L4
MAYIYEIFDNKGKKVGDQKMSKDIFSDDVIDEGLVHEYVVMYLSNQRQSTAHTKTRSEVRNSGRKLYRQKGTGSARVGDAGSPIRRK